MNIAARLITPRVPAQLSKPISRPPSRRDTVSSHSGRSTRTTPRLMATAAPTVPEEYSRRPRTTGRICCPISRNTNPCSRKSASRQTALTCKRLAPEVKRGVSWPIISPATATASTPDTCAASPSRYAANGVASDSALTSNGS